EHVDEESADYLALLLRLGDAGQAFEEQTGRVPMDERDVVVVTEQRHHLLALALAQQPVVDEDAVQLVADRFVNKHGSNRGIDAAREAADHAALADLLADARDRLLLKCSHRPVAGATDDMAHEVAEKPATLRRVHDLWMEHDPVVAPPVIGEDGERRAVA